MTRIASMLMAVVALANLAGCSSTGREQIQNGGEASMAQYTPPAGTCRTASVPDDTLIGKSEQDASTLLNGCLWRVSERDGKALPGTMGYREERRNLGIQNGRVIWVRRG
ncbi:hypothetical protein [Ralstonia pickettii]|nr:hypothetical protein [Ralstonia pickettii]